MLSSNIEIPVGSSSICFSTFPIINDAIPENDERLLIIVIPVNPLDVAIQNTTLLIIDNDGLCSRNRFKLIKLIYTIFCVGVNLVVSPQNVNIMEGEIGEICVEFTQGQILAERAVTFSVSESSSMPLKIKLLTCTQLIMIIYTVY